METNIHVFHTTKNRTMAFLGKVKPERWSRLLKPIDDLTRFAVSRSIREDVFFIIGLPRGPTVALSAHS